MIVRMTGKLVHATMGKAILERDGLAHELYVPAFLVDTLTGRVGQDLTFYTIEYYEGTAVGANLYPRMVGFLNASDRAFFMELIKVKGLGIKKALRAFARPSSWIAAAIEQGDVNQLAALPEFGKRTAEQLIASLKGKLERFALAELAPAAEKLDRPQHEALEILLQLGERRQEALALIRQASADGKVTDAAGIVETVYRLKSGSI